MSDNLEHFGFTDGRKYKIEEYFDKHPIPWDVEIYRFKSKSYKVEIFCASEFKDDYLVKITCNNMRRSVTLSRELKSLSDAMGLERIVIGRKLFLLRRSFFQC